MRGDKNGKITRKKTARLIFGLIYLIGLISIQAMALDYPHFGVNNIGCDSCHFIYGTEPSLLPPWTAHEPQHIDDTQYNTLCWSCHNDVDAPYVRTHSSRSIDDSYGDWTVECRVCHNPHYQKQKEYGSASYLYSGASTTVTATTITKTGADWETDAFEGMVVVPNISQNKYVYKITDNTDDTLTVQGPMDLTKVTTGNTFAILYGNLINKAIDLSKITIDPSKSGSKTVRFFRKTGTKSFADGDSTYDGVCEVCHTQTTHFRNDGSGSNQLHTNVGSPAGTNCIECHSHVNGFAHGGSGGTGCDECHGHDPGYEGVTGGKGTYVTHSTHTENDSDDLRGPHVGCATCHNTSSFPNFADGVSYNDYKSGAEMTTVCNPCHSPDGTYNGVSDSAIGARNNWSVSTSSDSRVYEADGSLKAGKEKWCATCHDEVPSQIQSVNAPNVVGGEDGSFTYGTGWGFYKTGHGLPASQTYPASGGVTDGAGKVCTDCHDSRKAHIDGDSRTFDCDNSSGGACSSDYQSGYRLKSINGEVPMEIPPTGRNAESYRLCFSCHTNTEDWLSSNLSYRDKTNFYDNGRSSEENLHIYHLRWSQSSELDWDTGTDGGMSCITCHNVHGSKNPVMIRSGELTGWESLSVRYGNSCSTHTAGQAEPVPDDITLEVSNKSTMLGNMASPYCSHCHGTGTGIVSVARTPAGVEDRAPVLNWVGGPAYESDGVNPDAAESGTEFTFKVEYSDVNQDGPPVTIQLWIDRNADGNYVNDDFDSALDEKIDMVSAFVEPDTCAPYSTGVDYVTHVTLDKNLLIAGNSITYKFYAYYGFLTATGPATSESTLTILNDAPTLEWTGESNYEDDGVTPDYGPQDGTYAFRVKYIDDDGDACPASGFSNIQVWIDLNSNSTYDTGEKFNLTEVSAGDTDCTESDDGKLYYTEQVLPNSSGSNIIYDYRFYASDGTDEATGQPVSSGGTVTVAGTANNPPLLAWNPETCRPEGARPERSATSSAINFSVRYYDEDNQCPTGGTSDIQVYVDLDNSGTYSIDEQFNLEEADGDADCTTSGGGKLYSVDVTPTAVADGITYEFHATDGTDEALGEPRTTGGTVDVINATKVVRQDGTEDYTTISAAISGTGSGATILVYDGTYTENLAIPQWQSRHFYSACGAAETIISHSNNPVVYFNHSGVSTLDGFTVTGGSGRGIYSLGTNFNGLQSTPTIKDCIIRNNSGRGIDSYASLVTITGSEIYENTGGGVNSYSTTITDSIIRNNSVSGDGGGIYGSNTLTNVIIKDNTATGNGGGIYCYNSSHPSFTYEKVTLTGNTAGGSGGGGYISWCYPTFTNSLVSDNSAPTGGGFSVGSWAGVKLKSSTITNNTATSGNGGVCYANGGGFDLANSIVWGNRAPGGTGHIAYITSSGVIDVKIYDSIIENNGDNTIYDDGYYYTPTPTYVRFSNDYIMGNYDTDPNFVDAGANGDYHINTPSDAFDNAADNSGWGIPADDLDGNIRPAGSEDIGAYERVSSNTVSFTSASQITALESGTAVITLQLSEVSDQDVTVPFTINGSSTATGGGTDYSITASPITITAGNTTANIIVTVASDSLDENNETVKVDMGTPTNATQGAITTHTVTITDDDATPTVTFTSALQSTAGESGTATITVQLSEVSGRSVTVPFTINGSSSATGSGTDYSISASPITITAGNTTEDITVTIAADSLDENNETVIIDMGTPTNATQGATTTHTVTITDDDAEPTVSFTSASQSTADESGTATITAQLSAESGKDVTVPFTVNAGSTATGGGTDYSITASPITITAGNTTGNVTVTITTDTDVESDETVIVDMGTPTNATQGVTTTHTVTITDDDAEPTVTFTSASQSTAGESGTATITAQLSAASGQDVTVPFTVNAGSTATGGGTDYSITISPITITAGNTTADITITIATDSLDESNETVVVDMGTPTNATQGAITTHTVTITDDDASGGTTYTVCSAVHADAPCDYQTITAGIAALTGGIDETLLVSAGTYAEEIDFSGKTFTLQSKSGAASTFITGDTSDDPVVKFLSANETSDAVLDGFTIDNATSSGNNRRGIYINGGASPTIRNSRINGNTPATYVNGAGININQGGITLEDSYVGDSGAGNVGATGGGIYIKTATGGPYAVSISGSTISYNTGTNGGGIYIDSTFNGTVNISGSTVSNNNGNGGYGPGIYSMVGMTITDTNISDNLDITSTNYAQGGGLSLTGTDKVTTFTGGSVTGNNAGSGGGIYVGGGADLTINGGAVISGNVVDNTTGGGIKVAGAGSTLTCSKAIIEGNDTKQYGGGIYIDGAGATLTNCNVTGNTADAYTYSRGGGIYITGTATLDIYNSTIAGNYAWYAGGGLYHNGGTTTATNSIFWDNAADSVSPEIYGTITATYCDVEGGYSGTGNINLDPNFVTPAAATNSDPTTGGDFHIQSGSNVIDQGTSTNAPSDDIDGDGRPIGSGIDMGADEKE